MPIAPLLLLALLLPAAAAAEAPLPFARTPERLARGRYLVEGVAACFGCHGQVDWKRTSLPRQGTEGGGGWVADDSVPFRIEAPNISPDPETGAGTWSDEVFVRALRQGIGHDGRTLFPLMPYSFFRELADEDLASVVAYVRSVPPVKRRAPRMEMPEAVKKTLAPLPPVAGPVAAPVPNDRVAVGRYLGTLAQCTACHTPIGPDQQPLAGLEFAGGQPIIGPWPRVASVNLTPHASGIPHYDEATFIRTIRSGKVAGVRRLSHIMPWEFFGKLSDADLGAIFAWLRTLAPVAHRVSNTDPPTRCRRCGHRHGLGDQN